MTSWELTKGLLYRDLIGVGIAVGIIAVIVLVICIYGFIVEPIIQWLKRK